MTTPLSRLRHPSHATEHSGFRHEKEQRLPSSLESFRNMAQGIIRANPVPVAFVPFQNEDYLMAELHEKFSSLLDQAISSTKQKETERLKMVRLILQELDANGVDVKAFLNERDGNGDTYLVKAVRMRLKPKIPEMGEESAGIKSRDATVIPENMRVIPPTLAMVQTIIDYGGTSGYLDAIGYMRSYVETGSASISRSVFAPDVYAYLYKRFLLKIKEY